MILSSLLGRIDTKNKDYLKLQEEISKISGGINASSHFYLDKNDEINGKLSLSSKSLPENSLEVTKLMFEILDETKFENDKRIKELVFQNFMGLQQTIVENGHRFAMLAASSSHNKLSLVQELSSGLSSLYKFAPFVSNNEEMLKAELEKQVKFFDANKNSANE
jgi:Zn-dependent M16 (insulinase) family peptidase